MNNNYFKAALKPLTMPSGCWTLANRDRISTKCNAKITGISYATEKKTIVDEL